MVREIPAEDIATETSRLLANIEGLDIRVAKGIAISLSNYLQEGKEKTVDLYDYFNHYSSELI